MYHLGTHLLIELYDCNRDLLDDADAIEDMMLEAAEASGATIISHHVNRFNPYGVSGVVIIAESHITVHTWPEHGYAAADVFTCGESVSPGAVKEVLEKRFEAERSTANEIKRGDFERPLRHKPESE